MNRLETIQKTFKVFEIITKVAEILCIVGGSLCALCIMCALTVQNGGRVFGIFGQSIDLFSGDFFSKTYVKVIFGLCNLSTYAVLLGFAHSYLKHEQEDGTPFCQRGAKRLRRLGIRCIYIPYIGAFFFWIIVRINQAEKAVEADTLSGTVVGIVLILSSLVFEYGAQLVKEQGKIPSFVQSTDDEQTENGGQSTVSRSETDNRP